MHNSDICKILSKQYLFHLEYWEQALELERVGAAANTVTPRKGGRMERGRSRCIILFIPSNSPGRRFVIFHFTDVETSKRRVRVLTM